ncbi:MAG: response regulator transcription factor [Nitrospirae bacterium]|nr:MAG: response regulator transcription factor [Nitrospirota bacterium]
MRILSPIWVMVMQRASDDSVCIMSIRLLIADDQRLFRQSLRIVLEHESDLQVVGEAGDGQEAYEQGKSLRPDVVLMDVEMPKLDGIAATRILNKALVGMKVLILSSFSDDDRVLQGIQAGAVGYIVKDATPEEFVEIIRATHSGVDVTSPYLANLNPIVLARLRSNGASTVLESSMDYADLNLSPREREIVALLVSGKSNKEMAEQIGLSSDTVKAHLQHIFRKIGVSSRLEAVVFLLTGRRAS